MSRITKSAEERRQEIIASARELFMENGFDKTQIADIANSMHVAQGLIYHYFKSKTDLLYAVIDEMAAEKMEVMKHILIEQTGTAVDGLTLLFNSQPDYGNYKKLISSLKSDQAIIEYCANKMTVSALPLLITLIERGNTDGSWKCEYPKETAIFILQGVSGHMAFSDDTSYQLSKIQALTNIIFRILGAAPASVD